MPSVAEEILAISLIVARFDYESMVSYRRDEIFASRRRIAMWLMYEAGMHPAQIAQLVNRDRSTVIHAVQVAQPRYKAGVGGLVEAKQKFEELRRRRKEVPTEVVDGISN